MKKEQWKAVVGYEGLYEVSNKGKVNSLPRNTTSGGVLKASLKHTGYYSVALSCDGKIKTKRVNRLVAEAFISNPENKPQVNHKDGVKTNNNDWNLEWSTASENGIHSYKLGMSKGPVGEKQGNHKLNEQQIIEIRKKYSFRRCDSNMLSKEYNVSSKQIRNIVNNKQWKHI